MKDTSEEMKKNLTATISQLRRANELFGEDVNRCLKTCIRRSQEIKKSHNDEDFKEFFFWFRCLIRAFFAHVEGITYVMRQIAFKAYERGEVKYSIGELVLLKEETYELKGNRIKSTNKFNPFLDNVKLTFMLFPRVFNSDFKLNTSNHGFECFQKALKARHSITHPKLRRGFIPFFDTLKDTQQAIIWFGENMRELIRSLR